MAGLFNVNFMRISVVGAGYVGLPTAVGFALKGHNVIAVTTTKEKADAINAGKSPIFEKGLDEGLGEVLSKGRLQATTDLGYAIKNTDVTFVAVGTPSREDGSIDLSQIEKAAEQIGSALKDKQGYHVVVVKSTVVPGTTEGVVKPALEKNSGKSCGAGFGIGMNPEFLREGRAMEDFLRPDRIVIGANDGKGTEQIEKCYENFDAPVVKTTVATAEMTKYASNAFLAAKISFMNELGNLCKDLHIDIYDVARGMGYDKRIAHDFLQSGCGWGGSCFPKDVKALMHKAKDEGHELSVLKNVMDVNERQKLRMVEMLKSKFEENAPADGRRGSPLKGKRIAVLGLAFKADTDDIRDAPAIDMIKALLAEGAQVAAYDPKAAGNMKQMFPNISYAASAREALAGADAAIIPVEWPEFAQLTDADFAAMRNKAIIEGRRILDPKKVSGYEGVNW